MGFDYSKNLYIDSLSNSSIKTAESKNTVVTIA